eukprot:scaffold105899_cov65-Phaeocystis_antarctica.AAC.2
MAATMQQNMSIGEGARSRSASVERSVSTWERNPSTTSDVSPSSSRNRCRSKRDQPSARSGWPPERTVSRNESNSQCPVPCSNMRASSASCPVTRTAGCTTRWEKVVSRAMLL